MKKNIIFGAIAALMLTSCIGDLDQEPMAGNIVNGVYENEASRMSALAKVYGSFSLVGQGGAGSTDIDVSDAGASEFLRAWWSIQTLSSDEAKCVWGDPWVADICGNKWTSVKNDAIYATYTRAMMMISYANDFLRNTNDNDQEIATERAEVRFLRAFAYWVMIDCFGNPPFVLETDPVGAANPKQISRTELFAWLQNELEELVSDTSALKAAHTQVYPRVDKGAAYALMTRLYLNHKIYLGQENPALYDDAAAAADEVIAAYPLAKNYRALFMGDNGENPDALNEIVYAACYDATKTQSYGGTSFLIIAGKNNSSLGIVDGWSGLITSSEAVVPFVGQAVVDSAKEGETTEAALTAIDQRALVTLAMSEDKAMNRKDFVKGWHVVKFNNNHFLDPSIDFGQTAKFSSVDFPLLRAGEMYLAYAEAKARKDGGVTTDAKAVEYVKALQARAGMQNSSVASSVSLDQIFDEISREMFWEGQRRTTLIRFDRYSSSNYLWPFKSGVENGQGFDKYMELFPMPSDDLLANENLVQNPGYNK